MNNSPQRAAKGFTRAFWVSNTVELFERMAYYAVFIVLTIYLSTILGFNDGNYIQSYSLKPLKGCKFAK